MSVLDDVTAQDIIKGLGAVAALVGALSGLAATLGKDKDAPPITQAELQAMFDAVDVLNDRIQQRVLEATADPVE
jgi:hypothetical protein